VTFIMITRTQMLLVMFSTAALLSCSSHPDLKPFTTDGCSMFPDRSVITHKDWCTCCVTHDFAYWRGGTAAQRLTADQALQACVLQATGNKLLAETMYAGVRAGGGPYYFTTYRWGYGWPYGRDYQPLTAEESAAANQLEANFRANHPQMSCESAMADKPVASSGQH
jgi:hypothetical protein